MQDRMYDSAAGFSRAIEEVAGTFQIELETAIRKAVLDLFRAIFRDSPVATGRLRASWSLTIDESDAHVMGEEYNDPRGAMREALDRAQSAGFGLGDVVYLINNVEYAEAIEYGHSQKAPEGMARKNLNLFTHHLENQVRQYWWGQQ